MYKYTVGITMQEHNLNIAIGPVNHSGEGFKVFFEPGCSDSHLLFAVMGMGYLKADEITVRELFEKRYDGEVLVSTTYKLFEIDTADSFDKRVNIKAETNHLKPTASEIIEKAFNETMEEMKPATSGICALEDIEFKTMGIDPVKDRVNYKIIGWTKDKAHRELKTGFITGSIESESAKEILAKRITDSDIAFAVIDESYHKKSVRDFAAQHKIKVATMKLVNESNQKDRYDDCFILASYAAGKVIKSNEKMTIEEWANKQNKEELEYKNKNWFINPIKNSSASDDFLISLNFLDENQAKRKAEDLPTKNTSGFGFNIELNYFDVLKEIKKPNSAAIVSVSNDDRAFLLNLSEFVSAYFKEGLELCDSATKLENALTTLSKAKDTEDDYLITCAELAVEELRDEVAFWSEQFKLLHSTNKYE